MLLPPTHRIFIGLIFCGGCVSVGGISKKGVIAWNPPRVITSCAWGNIVFDSTSLKHLYQKRKTAAHFYDIYMTRMNSKRVREKKKYVQSQVHKFLYVFGLKLVLINLPFIELRFRKNVFSKRKTWAWNRYKIS